MSLPPGQIHVRALWLKADGATVRFCRSVLSRDEDVRANRFRFEDGSRAYTIAHAGLRFLLASYLSCPPREVEFASGAHGKPQVRGNRRIHFNMAHSENLALYALASDCEVGIDVEVLRPTLDLETVARRYFSSAEASELLSIGSSSARTAAFFRCWTRKEAYIKAVGEGLCLPLDQFRVTLCSGDPARFVHIGNDPAEADKWHLHHLDPAPNYLGALAYRDDLRQIDISQPLDVSELFRNGGS